MERSPYGKERRVKRVRISSTYTALSSLAVEDLGSEPPHLRQCKATVNFSEVLTTTVAQSLGVAKRKKLLKSLEEVVRDEQAKSTKVVGTEMVVWTNGPASAYSLTLCEECKGGDSAEQMLLCDQCDRGFHMFCLSPILVSIPPGDWICPHCSKSTIAHEFLMVQKKIVDYFRIQNLLPSKSVTEAIERKKRKKQSAFSFCPPKRGRRLLPYVPTIDPQRRLKQMASLATALTSIGVQFSDSLSYRYAPRTANRAAHEKGGMRRLLLW